MTLELPKELLLEVSTHLPPKDIVSLAETNQHIFSALAALRNLFLKCPYSRLHFSQWNTWQAFAENWNQVETNTSPFKQVGLPKHTNQPLPRNFKALQGDLGRQWGSDWNSCDRGICGPRQGDEEADLLVLTDPQKNSPEKDSPEKNSSEKEANKPTCELLACHSYGRRLYPTQFEIGYKISTQGEALLEWNMESDSVILYTMFKDCVRHSTTIDEKKGFKIYHMQFIDDVALVFVLDGDVQNTYYLVPNGKLTALDFGGCKVPQEGLMMYNGHFYKTVLDEKVDIQVAHVSQSMGKPTTMSPGAAYETCQDLRFPRYGLVYSNSDHNLAHVIDLQKQKISQCLLHDKDVCLVGLTDGELAIWKYTREYLENVCEERGMGGFKKVVENILEGNENWEEFHRELVEAWVD